MPHNMQSWLEDPRPRCASCAGGLEPTEVFDGICRRCIASFVFRAFEHAGLWACACAWCGVLTSGIDTADTVHAAGISHTMCSDCSVRVNAETERWLLGLPSRAA